MIQGAVYLTHKDAKSTVMGGDGKFHFTPFVRY
jgi:hypothetical protein